MARRAAHRPTNQHVHTAGPCTTASWEMLQLKQETEKKKKINQSWSICSFFFSVMKANFRPHEEVPQRNYLSLIGLILALSKLALM